MDENSPDGCYGTLCRNCKYVNAEQGSEDRIKCDRLRKLALKKLTQGEF